LEKGSKVGGRKAGEGRCRFTRIDREKGGGNLYRGLTRGEKGSAVGGKGGAGGMKHSNQKKSIDSKRTGRREQSREGLGRVLQGWRRLGGQSSKAEEKNIF